MDDTTLGWPRPLLVRPGVVAGVIAGWVALAALIFVAIDLVGLATLPGGSPAWWQLYNDRPVEWTQWLLQGAAILAAGFIAGRITDPGDRGVRSFLLLLGAGLVLMLFEDAGDARHAISAQVAAFTGPTILGLPHRVVVELPYFLAIAALPVAAVVLHGRSAWRAAGARGYLIGGYVLYALAGGGSALRHLGDLYVRVGGAIDRILLGGRFPVRDGMAPERAHFYVIDGPIEESVETLAAALLLAGVLAIGREVRLGRLEPPRG